MKKFVLFFVIYIYVNKYFIYFIFLIIGSDGYVAAPTSGFTAPPSGPHQNTPVLRSMQSTAQPVQSQQQDLSKMQQPPQQSMVSQLIKILFCTYYYT